MIFPKKESLTKKTNIHEIPLIMYYHAVFNCFNGNSQVSNDDISGKWTGILSAPDANLRIVVNMTRQTDGSYTATLESPDQTTMAFPVKEVTFENDSLLLDVPVIEGQYKAVITTNASMDGFWIQRGSSFPLKLTKTEVLKSE